MKVIYKIYIAKYSKRFSTFAPANTFDYKTFVNGLKNGNHATKGMRRAVGEQSRERHLS
jgi:hypothetical protein